MLKALTAESCCYWLTLLNINSRRVRVLIRNRNEKLFFDVKRWKNYNCQHCTFWSSSKKNLFSRIKGYFFIINVPHTKILVCFSLLDEIGWFKNSRQIYLQYIGLLYIYWSSCTKLALSGSWTHGLIAQSVRASARNSVVVGSNPTQANFL